MINVAYFLVSGKLTFAWGIELFELDVIQFVTLINSIAVVKHLHYDASPA
jgi:hypothetical protein